MEKNYNDLVKVLTIILQICLVVASIVKIVFGAI